MNDWNPMETVPEGNDVIELNVGGHATAAFRKNGEWVTAAGQYPITGKILGWRRPDKNNRL